MNDQLELKTLLKHLFASGKTPGLQYVVRRNNETIFQENLGMAEFESKTFISKSSFFNACSVTKTFTSLAIMQLAEAGRLKLSDPAAPYLDNIHFPEGITISQLLSHTSGLPNPIPLRWAHLQEEEAAFDYDNFVSTVLKKYALQKFPAGEKMSYSNLNYLPLGQIISKVSSLPYRDYIRQHIISRLELQDEPMDFLIPDDTHYARGYQKRFSWVNAILGYFIDKKKFTTKSSNDSWIKFNKYYVSGRAYGGLIANAYSLTKFIQILFAADSVLLSDEWKKILFTKQKTKAGKEVDMTLGWFTGKLNGVDYFAHAGAGGGYYCEMRSYPALHMSTAIMFNRSGIRDERFLDQPDRYFLSGTN